YWIAKAGGKPVAGILDMRGIVPDSEPPHWLSYLEVDDVDRRLAEIESHGGKIVRPPFDVPNFGRIAIGADATGAFLAWVTSKRCPGPPRFRCGCFGSTSAGIAADRPARRSEQRVWRRRTAPLVWSECLAPVAIARSTQGRETRHPNARRFLQSSLS